jgi:hypothetical protein
MRKARSARSADAGYPSAALIAASQGAAASLASIQSAKFPGQATLAAGDYAFVGVLILKASGKVLVSGCLSYALATATSATWQWTVLFGPFTVNGVAPTPGITKHPTIAGGTASPIMLTGALPATPGQVVITDTLLDFSLAGPNPLPLGSPIGFGLQLSASGGSGTVTAGASASPFAGGGQLYLQEFAGSGG